MSEVHVTVPAYGISLLPFLGAVALIALVVLAVLWLRRSRT
jgi:hypothetical protein